VQAEASEVVGHPARGHGAGIEAQQGREVSAQVFVGEPVGQESEDDQDAQEGLDTGSPKRSAGPR
jgi:hypothetical protein